MLDIIAEEISDEPKYRKFIKFYINRDAFIVSKELVKDEKDTFGNYADYREKNRENPATPHLSD